MGVWAFGDDTLYGGVRTVDGHGITEWVKDIGYNGI
jgi:hypothetical protein